MKFFYTLNRISPIRVSKEDEHIGLNISEHNAKTDFIDLFLVMNEHAKLNDLRKRIPEEPFTEVGMIASLYNKVMGALESAVEHTNAVVSTAMEGIITVGSDGSIA